MKRLVVICIVLALPLVALTLAVSAVTNATDAGIIQQRLIAAQAAQAKSEIDTQLYRENAPRFVAVALGAFTVGVLLILTIGGVQVWIRIDSYRRARQLVYPQQGMLPVSYDLLLSDSQLAAAAIGSYHRVAALTASQQKQAASVNHDHTPASALINGSERY